MADYGVTPQGFNRKRLDVLLNELNEAVKGVFGEEFNVSPESPDGQVNGIVSESNALLWEAVHESYDAFNPSAASGVTLSNLVQINGIERLDESPSLALLNVTGDPGVTIPSGSFVSSGPGTTVFETTEDVILDGSGNGVVNSQATVAGPNIALAGTLTVIETPISGWATVTNPNNADIGRFEETDAQLRARRERSTGSPSQGQFESVAAAILNVDGVSNGSIIENNTANVVDGMPPHSFQTFVVGGLASDIAREIYVNGPLGIQPYGTTTITVIDDSGNPHDIGFSRPAELIIYVIVNISVESGYPTNGDDIIKQNIVEYANGNLISGRGFGLGDDVINSRLYTPVNIVPGHSVSSILIGTGNPPVSESDIILNSGEIAFFDINNISVVHV